MEDGKMEVDWYQHRDDTTGAVCEYLVDLIEQREGPTWCHHQRNQIPRLAIAACFCGSHAKGDCHLPGNPFDNLRHSS